MNINQEIVLTKVRTYVLTKQVVLYLLLVLVGVRTYVLYII